MGPIACYWRGVLYRHHGQPSYHPLDQQICNRYGDPVSRQLQTPSRCSKFSLPFVPDLEGHLGGLVKSERLLS